MWYTVLLSYSHYHKARWGIVLSIEETDSDVRVLGLVPAAGNWQ